MKLDLESMIGVARLFFDIKNCFTSSGVCDEALSLLLDKHAYTETHSLLYKTYFQHCLSNILIKQTYNTCVHSAPAFLRLYNHMKNMQQKTVFALLVIVVTTVLPHCLVSHIWFPIFLTGSKQLTNVSSPIKIPFAISWQFVLVPFCLSPVNILVCDINQAEICRNFKTPFKMKCTRNGGMPIFLAVSLIV